MNLLTNNLAEVKITYSCKIPACDRIKIRCSQDADKALRLIWSSFEHREFFYIMLLNRSNQILGFSQISMGGISGTVTDWTRRQKYQTLPGLFITFRQTG